MVIGTAEGTVEANALTAARSGVHTTAEYDLSRALLARLAAGAVTVDPPLTWRRARPETPACTRPAPRARSCCAPGPKAARFQPAEAPAGALKPG
ncbi:putative protein OS=Streptomyces fumanus OX=67302 GN=GCM10018772_11490 PE=4 SV=1 [Streptomyces fumanus]